MPVATKPQPTSSDSSAATASSEAHVSLEKAGVRYTLLTEEQRSLKGRVLNVLGSHDPATDFWALRNVNLDVKPGEVVGLVGRNGSGKSTLLRVMSGILAPTEGTAKTSGVVTPLLELGAAFNGELTGRENAYLYGALLKRSKEETAALIPQIMAFSELGPFFDVPVKSYSSGMFARLAFAISTQGKPEILLLDEVLSVGDEHFQKKSFGRIQKLIEIGTIVVIVAHASSIIQNLCTRAVLLHGGNVMEDGQPSRVLQSYSRLSPAAG